MDVPVQLMVFSIPSLLYILVQRLRGQGWHRMAKNVGWWGSAPIFFLWALAVTVGIGGLGWLAFRFIPSEVLQDPKLNITQYAGRTLSVASFLLVWLREAFYVALGEEVFFRGFLGGWLVRRSGFPLGNTLQALVFLLPHLLLLRVSLSLWPVVLVQGIAGWLLGWLRFRSDSILPGWLAHSLGNALGALAAMG